MLVPMLVSMLVSMLVFMFMPMLMPKISIIIGKSAVSCTFASVRYLNLDEN